MGGFGLITGGDSSTATAAFATTSLLETPFQAAEVIITLPIGVTLVVAFDFAVRTLPSEGR